MVLLSLVVPVDGSFLPPIQLIKMLLSGDLNEGQIVSDGIDLNMVPGIINTSIERKPTGNSAEQEHKQGMPEIMEDI